MARGVLAAAIAILFLKLLLNCSSFFPQIFSDLGESVTRCILGLMCLIKTALTSMCKNMEASFFCG